MLIEEIPVAQELEYNDISKNYALVPAAFGIDLKGQCPSPFKLKQRTNYDFVLNLNEVIGWFKDTEFGDSEGVSL